MEQDARHVRQALIQNQEQLGVSCALKDTFKIGQARGNASSVRLDQSLAAGKPGVKAAPRIHM